MAHCCTYNKVYSLSSNISAEKVKLTLPNKIKIKCYSDTFLHLLITVLCSYCQRPHFQEKEPQSLCFVLEHSGSTMYSSLGVENCKKHKLTDNLNILCVINLPSLKQILDLFWKAAETRTLSNNLEAPGMVGCPFKALWGGSNTSASLWHCARETVFSSSSLQCPSPASCRNLRNYYPQWFCCYLSPWRSADRARLWKLFLIIFNASLN